MSQRILFVCLGNICRSPSAEGVVRARAAARGLDLQLDSAGTGDWHLGDPPYGPMQDSARARGYDLSALRARRVTQDGFYRFDLIIAMDADNLDTLERLRPADGAPLRLFTDFAPETGLAEVPDPYFSRDFDGTLDLIERCADGLVAHLGH